MKVVSLVLATRAPSVRAATDAGPQLAAYFVKASVFASVQRASRVLAPQWEAIDRTHLRTVVYTSETLSETPDPKNALSSEEEV